MFTVLLFLSKNHFFEVSPSKRPIIFTIRSIILFSPKLPKTFFVFL